ncbi:hypothetical protein GCM10022221_38960 [Actinocorallia aurea]
MPRRHPKDLLHVPLFAWHDQTSTIRGVSEATRAAIRRLEADHLWRGAVADALLRSRAILERSGRFLAASEVHEPGLEIEDQLEVLNEALRCLPPEARKDLQRQVVPIFEEFERRTLPDPGPHSAWVAQAGWWWRRIRER